MSVTDIKALIEEVLKELLHVFLILCSCFQVCSELTKNNKRKIVPMRSIDTIMLYSIAFNNT